MKNKNASLARIGNVFVKEFRNTFSNLSTVAMITVVPLLLTIQSIGVFIGAATGMKASDLNNPMIQTAIKRFTQSNPDLAAIPALGDMDKFLIFTYLQFPIYMMLIPVLIASVIMTFSVVEEKQTRTLEPLLATPVRTWELLLGKTLAGSAPSILIGWICGALFIAAVMIVQPKFLANYNGAAYWCVFAFLLVPLMTVLSSAIGIIGSAKATDAKNAQGMAILVILPVMGLVGLNVSGILAFSLVNQLLISGVILVATVFTMRVAVSSFQRENILSKWKF